MALTRDRGGFGVLITSILVLLAMLSVSFSLASLGGGVTAETQNVSDGNRALEIARSCLAEAMLDFRKQVNAAGSPWYESTRAHRTSAAGMEDLIVGEYTPAATLAAVAGEDVSIAPVRVSVWHDFAIDPENGPYDEKYALVTLTADVSVRPSTLDPFRGRVRRQLQRSYQLKETRIVPPRPFSDWTLYVHRVPQLQAEKDAYDRLIRAVAHRRETIERFYGGEIDDIIRILKGYLNYMVRKARDWDQARDEIKKSQGALEMLIGATAGSMGMTASAVTQLTHKIESMKQDLKDDIARNLTAFNLSDEATFRQVAAHPYPPENLRADIDFQLAHGSWPAFRGYEATPEGLGKVGQVLSNPVVVEREEVTSREIGFTLPEPPAPPLRPRYSLRTQDIQWLGHYASIARVFRDYVNRYRSTLDTFTSAYAAEFKRHEDLFRLLDHVPAEYQRYLTDLGYQSRRASWFYQSQDTFLKAVVGTDGIARLNGVYAVKGDLTRFPASFVGRGYVTVESHLTLGDVGARRDSTAVFFAGGDATLNGSCDAAVLVPAGRLKSRELSHTVAQAVVNVITPEDDFTVKHRPEPGADGAEGLWVNVAPAPVAEALLRD